MNIGDRITMPIDWLAEAETGGGRRLMKKTSLTGTVVYIHPRLRFYKKNMCIERNNTNA